MGVFPTFIFPCPQLVASFDEVPEAEKKHVWNTMFPIPDEAVARALHLERWCGVLRCILFFFNRIFV